MRTQTQTQTQSLLAAAAAAFPESFAAFRQETATRLESPCKHVFARKRVRVQCGRKNHLSLTCMKQALLILVSRAWRRRVEEAAEMPLLRAGVQVQNLVLGLVSGRGPVSGCRK